MPRFASPGRDWHRDLPDFRDHTLDHPLVQEMLGRLKHSGSPRARKPSQVNLREYFPEVVDQGPLHCSAAHACVGLVEYFQRRAHGDVTKRSVLFLYKMARKLSGVEGDTGADLRTTLKALVRFGVPPARYWPYHVSRFDKEPGPFLYGFADRFRSICYVRLDARNLTGGQTLQCVRSFLAAGFPAAFGFVVPNSVSGGPDIPYRPTFDSIETGQAAIAVGYDDRRLRCTRGALLVRPSWGPRWGEHGYGWLPYAYVQNQLAVDFWTLLRADWLDSGEFQQPVPRAIGSAESPRQQAQPAQREDGNNGPTTG